MGITSDIGQDIIDYVDSVLNENGYPDAFDIDAFGWCYKHDHNTIVDICNLCEENPDYRNAAIDWVKRYDVSPTST